MSEIYAQVYNYEDPYPPRERLTLRTDKGAIEVFVHGGNCLMWLDPFAARKLGEALINFADGEMNRPQQSNVVPISPERV